MTPPGAHGFPLSHASKREDGPHTRSHVPRSTPGLHHVVCPKPVWGAMCPLHWRATLSRSGKTSTMHTAQMCTPVGMAGGRACPDPTRLLTRYVSSTALKEGRGPALVGSVEAASPSLSPTASPRLQARGARGLAAALGVVGRVRHASELFQLHHYSHTHTHTNAHTSCR